MNSKIKALVVDDEINARRSLIGILESYFPQVEIVGEAKDVPEAVKAIHKSKPQVVFLDIEMPGYSGLTILDFFDNSAIDFKLIFVTAYSEYALNAFELSAIDYVLKPIRKEAIERALSKIIPLQVNQLDSLREHLEHNSVPTNNKKIALHTSEGLLFVKLDDIIYLKADGSYTHIFFQNCPRITTTKRLMEYEKLETIGKFLRIHRSQIINLNQIARITKQDGGTVVMSNGDELSISNDKKSILLAAIEEEKI
jgi:two-component system, LytTR family, response regulator